MTTYDVAAIGRFVAKVTSSDGSSCWDWTANTNRGYGRLKVAGRFVYAHRFAYEAAVGPVPSGLQLDHLCRNRRCVNPAHLEPVSPRENTQRGNGLAGQNSRKTACPQGHPYDEDNTNHYRGSRYCRACAKGRAWPDERI